MVADNRKSAAIDKSRGSFANRSEAVAEELKRAAQFGLAPPNDIALDDRFRVEGLARLAPAQVDRIHAPSMRASATIAAASMLDNPFRNAVSAKQAEACTAAILKAGPGEYGSLQADAMIGAYRSLAASGADADAISKAEQQILAVLVGPDFKKQTVGGNADKARGAK